MNFVIPSDSRTPIKAKRLKKITSRPVRPPPQQALPAIDYQQSLPYRPQYPPQWNASSVDITTNPSANIGAGNFPPPYSGLELQPQPPPQNFPFRPVIQQHNWASTSNLLSDYTTSQPSQPSVLPPHIEQDSYRDTVADQLSNVISLIDEEAYPESGRELVISVPQSPPPSYSQIRSLSYSNDNSQESDRSLLGASSRLARNPRQQQQSRQNRSVNVLTKLSHYSNSRLPASLPPFRVYISTYPLLCLAALCSSNAYHVRQNAVKDEQLVSADARIGSKAMVIKSVTCSDERTLVFAIRGTSVLSLRDWNVNLNTTPESPAGFLDDEGNYCHSGFLRVAKAMVKPIAARLRHLLEENPNRLSYSLLITGHSAGGAVASLIFAHMLAEHVTSELTILANCFKRVHCVTFGAPPISLLPLKKPASKEDKLQKCLFHSFMNEGDPVVRAEKSYILSLVDLLTTTPAAAASLVPNTNTAANAQYHSHEKPKPSAVCSTSMNLLKITNLGILTGSKTPKHRNDRVSVPLLPPRPQKQTQSLTWAVPPSTLSNAGRLVVLRGPGPPPKASTSRVDLSKEFEEVRAYTVTDEEIRKVIFGDPLMHGMDVYRRRIEALAMKAVTGRDKYFG